MHFCTFRYRHDNTEIRHITKLRLSQGKQGRARHSVRAADSNPFAERRARSDAPYLT